MTARPRFCTSCGEAIPGGARYCGSCGQQIIQTPARLPLLSDELRRASPPTPPRATHAQRPSPGPESSRPVHRNEPPESRRFDSGAGIYAPLPRTEQERRRLTFVVVSVIGLVVVLFLFAVSSANNGSSGFAGSGSCDPSSPQQCGPVQFLKCPAIGSTGIGSAEIIVENTNTVTFDYRISWQTESDDGTTVYERRTAQAIDVPPKLYRTETYGILPPTPAGAKCRIVAVESAPSPSPGLRQGS